MPRVSMLMVRLATVWGFLGILPLLALPPVNRRINQWIHATPATSLTTQSGADGVGLSGENESRSPAGEREAVVVSSVVVTDSEVLLPTVAAQASSSSDASPVGGDQPGGGPSHPDTRPSNHTPLWEPHRVMAIQERLKELGARYLILENLRDRQIYRFHCRVDVGDHAIYARVFESLDAQPQRAMECVLSDVEAWISAQRAVETPVVEQ